MTNCSFIDLKQALLVSWGGWWLFSNETHAAFTENRRAKRHLRLAATAAPPAAVWGQPAARPPLGLQRGRDSRERHWDRGRVSVARAGVPAAAEARLPPPRRSRAPSHGRLTPGSRARAAPLSGPGLLCYRPTRRRLLAWCLFLWCRDTRERGRFAQTV